MRRGPIGRPDQLRLPYGRFLLRPWAVAGTRWELPVAAICIISLAAAFLAEVLTPEAVVGGVALLPLLIAVWLLSNRWVALVVAVAVVLFGIAVTLDAPNRLTSTLVGSVALVTVLTARLYATAFASLLSSHRHLRPGVPTDATAATLDGIDRSSRGVRSLTRRELEVARVAAEGYATPEIAQRLHIGERTVESHLSSAYSKLRIGSRAELIRMASRLGVPSLTT
jgi:DNA-binding CsgD family transcriptional regulator